MSLLDDDEGQIEQPTLKINASFAQKYQFKKEKEDLSKLRQVEEEYEEESTSESEDEDAEALTKDVEIDFFKTLSLLKGNNPAIYDKEKSFFKEHVDVPANGNGAAKPKKDKPVYLKDHERNRLLTRGVNAFVSDDEEENPPVNDEDLPYVEQQARLKKSLIEQLHGGSDEEGEGDFLKVRSKSKEETENEAEEYRRWLAGQGGKPEMRLKEDLEPLQRFWTDPNLSEDDKFLRDYITKQLWRDDRQQQQQQPAYEEVVALSEDDEELDKQEEFERKINFRFEEEGGAEIQQFPRTIATSVRREDTRRKDERERKKQRDEEKKAKKDEELRRLKTLKRKEIAEKLKQIQEISGAEVAGLEEGALLEEFDPDKHDSLLGKMFDNSYYEQEDENLEAKYFEEGEDDEPVGDGAAEGEAMEEYAGGEGQDEEQYEEENFNMDADFTPLEAKLSKKNKKNKKDKKGKKGAVEEPVALSEDTGKTVADALDEYYRLDYEDIVGGVPCRFKYRQVEAQDYGLAAEEILMADEKELNQWVSLKKAVRIRSYDEEKRDRKKYRIRAKDTELKKRIFHSIFGEPEEEAPPSDARDKKRKTDGGDHRDKSGKHPQKKKSSKPSEAGEAPPHSESNGDADGNEEHKKKKAKKAKSEEEAAKAAANSAGFLKRKAKDVHTAPVDPDRLAAYKLL